jgi:peptide/nickel transport system permease protein
MVLHEEERAYRVTRYIIRRLIQAVVMLFVMSIGFFLLLHAIPGGPESVLGGNPHLTAAQRALYRHRLGLDKPLPFQYFDWLGKLLHGDFGNSYLNGLPVINEIGTRLGATLELFLAALAFALVCAVLFGVLAAVRQYSILDYAITVFSYAGISMPIFWIALILQEIFGVQLRLLPTFSNQSADTTGFSSTDYFIDGFLHLILPAIVLSIQFIALWSRYLRSSMLDVIKQDYVRTARMKGLSGRKVFFRHALRNALIPLVTVVAIGFGGILGGAVVTETVFAWPGMGLLFTTALNALDFPTLLTFLILGAANVILFNLIADILYGVIDPRIRYS